MLESLQFADIFHRLIDLCREAGKEILEVYETSFEVENKDDESPLTMADRHSHEVITKGLTKATIGGYVLPALSEEGKGTAYKERSKWEYFWLVDPLDGTKEFIKRNGEFTVNIALVRRREPVLGIIYVPINKVAYFAAKGMGAYRLDDTVSKDPADVLLISKRLPCIRTTRPFTVVGSRSHMSRETEDYVIMLKEKHRAVKFISAGSSLKFCLIAEGRADVYPRFGPTMEWDTAAGQIIIEESGGEVVGVDDGKPVVYNKESLVNPWFIAARQNA